MGVPFRIGLYIYSAGIELVVWAALVPVMLSRVVVGRTTMDELFQRLWGASGPERCVLIHGVSAGEMVAAEPLVRRFGVSGRSVLLATGTRSGIVSAERIAQTHPHVQGCVWLPWDRLAVRQWLRALRPAAVVVMETEIWPNLFAACRALDIPLFIANGRVRRLDVRRYRLAGGFFRHVLACAAWIGAQSIRERDAFLAIGARPDHVDVAGNLKFDAAPASRHRPSMVDPECGRRLVVAGSTHEPEEAWLFDCVARLRRDGRRLGVVVAPRDISRADRIARLARQHSLAAMRWSTLCHAEPAGRSSWDVLVVDEYGWLSSFYERADLVFVGGTLVPVGGHNIIEAARLGRPVMVGPYLDEVESIVERLDDAGAIIHLGAGDPVAALVKACAALLDDPECARSIGATARDICLDHTGVADRYWGAMTGRLPAH